MLHTEYMNKEGSMVNKGKSIRRRPHKMTMALPEKKTKVRLAIECSPEERKFIKMYASYEDKTLNEFVMDCVRMKVSQCKRSHVPNEETEAVLDATERGEGIIMFDSIDDFFESMRE